MEFEDRDRHLIHDLLARWCWLMDAGNAEEWVLLWTDDGTFTGIPETAKGPEQLGQIPVQFHEMGGGKFRHSMSNITLEPGANADEAVAHAYSTLTDWSQGGALIGFAQVCFDLVRRDRGWKIRAQHAEAIG